MKTPAFHAAQSYNLAKSALKSETAGANPNENAANVKGLEQSPAFKAVHDLAGTVAKGETAAVSYMTGSADPHSVVEALAQAELAVQTAVTVRDKVVEAYQELIRMPV